MNEMPSDLEFPTNVPAWTTSDEIDFEHGQERKLAQYAGTTRKLTPTEEVGPSYPLAPKHDRGDDLTIVPDTGAKAKGDEIVVTGRVLTMRDTPVAGAKVEMWQANAHGRYAHPSDKNPVPLDPNFEGYGTIVTGEDGRYRFKTIKPGPYPTGVPGWWRPPHIHFQITTSTDRLVTQMYFPGEPLNEKDELLGRHRRLGAADRVVARVRRDDEIPMVEFDLVIAP
jgi:protocatechuate 3,4-dioxygenase beta subunit